MFVRIPPYQPVKPYHCYCKYTTRYRRLPIVEEATGIQGFSSLRYAIYALEQQITHQLQRLPLSGPGIYVISDNIDH